MNFPNCTFFPSVLLYSGFLINSLSQDYSKEHNLATEIDISYIAHGLTLPRVIWNISSLSQHSLPIFIFSIFDHLNLSDYCYGYILPIRFCARLFLGVSNNCFRCPFFITSYRTECHVVQKTEAQFGISAWNGWGCNMKRDITSSNDWTFSNNFYSNRNYI